MQPYGTTKHVDYGDSHQPTSTSVLMVLTNSARDLPEQLPNAVSIKKLSSSTSKTETQQAVLQTTFTMHQ